MHDFLLFIGAFFHKFDKGRIKKYVTFYVRMQVYFINVASFTCKLHY